MADLGPGEKLGRFLIDKKLGKGASGVVYLAQDTVLAQHVALKVLHPWLIDVVEVRERFKREIVLTRRITAAGVCRIHDLHEDSDITFVTMEYIEGKTLSEIIQTDGRQTPTRVLEMLVGLAPALDAAHAAGIVHRDLKPGNIMVRHDGSLCVLDFGMATAADVTRITQAGRTVGSLRFIAPEVWQGEPATAKSDIYAVGVVLFACMAGRLPYEARTPAEAFAAQKQGPPSLMEHNAAVTPGIDAVVRQAMARRPQDRFDNVEQVRAAFATALNFEEATSSTGTVIVRPRDPQDPDNVRLTPMKEAEGDVFSSTPVRVPKPVMIGVAIVIAVIAVAITAALVAAPTRAVDAGSDGAVDAGTPHHLVVRAASPPPIGDTVDDIGDDTGSDDSAPDRVVPRASSHHSLGVAATAPASSARTATLAAMKKRGLLPGDAPAVDGLLAKARRLEAQGKAQDAAAALDGARDQIGKAPIDRGFITAKQKRLSFAADRAPAANQKKIAALQSDVEKLVVQRDYAGANDKLNRAFALLH